jgi:hypothetical protein
MSHRRPGENSSEASAVPQCQAVRQRKKIVEGRGKARQMSRKRKERER